MPNFVLRGLFAAVGLWVATFFLGGLYFDSPTTLLIAGLTLGLINAFVRPILFVLTLPVTVLTLGLFILILNGAMVSLVSHLLHGMHVASFGTAVAASLIVSIVSFIGQAFWRK